MRAANRPETSADEGPADAPLAPSPTPPTAASSSGNTGVAPSDATAATDNRRTDAAEPLAPNEASASAPAAVSALTLEQAIHETLCADPKLHAAMEAIRQARADFITSSLAPNPTLAVNGVFIPLRRLTPEEPGGPPELDAIVGFPIDWFLFGKRAAAMVNAQLSVDVSAADYADQVRQRVAGTIAAYFDVLEAKALVSLAREDLANLKRVEAMTRERVRLGGVGTIEFERIHLSVLDAEREVRSRETTLATARAQFRAAVGRGVCCVAVDAAGNLEVPVASPALEVDEAWTIAEQNRPDIISLRRQIAKARSGIEVEQTKAHPSVVPTFGYQHQFQHDFGFLDVPNLTATVSVTLPVSDRNQGNICKAQSILAQTCYNLQAELVQLRADIEQAVAEFQAARTAVTSIGPAQLAAARSVRDRTEAAYLAGGKTLLELLDAQRAYRDTYRTYILGQSSYWHSLYRLNAAVGKQVLR